MLSSIGVSWCPECQAEVYVDSVDELPPMDPDYIPPEQHFGPVTDFPPPRYFEITHHHHRWVSTGYVVRLVLGLHVVNSEK